MKLSAVLFAASFLMLASAARPAPIVAPKPVERPYTSPAIANSPLSTSTFSTPSLNKLDPKLSIPSPVYRPNVTYPGPYPDNPVSTDEGGVEYKPHYTLTTPKPLPIAPEPPKRPKDPQ